MVGTAEGGVASGDAVWPRPAAGWWTVGVLTLVYLCSFVDRTILSLLVEPIKADLGASDTEIALLQGAAFGIFFAIAGLPFGWLADVTRNRIRWVAVAAVFWSLMTICSGFARSLAQLFVFRAGLAIGEAGLSPLALSTVSDSFPHHVRGLPIAFYTAAGAFGAGLSLLIGGAVLGVVSGAEEYRLFLIGRVAGWQAAFIIVGSLSLLVLPLLLSIREPARREELAREVSGGPLWGFVQPHLDFFVRHYGALTIYALLTHAVLSWMPSLLIRAHGWSPSDAGLLYGLVVLIFGGAGPFAGVLADRALARRGRDDSAVLVTAGGMALAGVFLPLGALAPSSASALALLALGLFGMTVPTATAIQIVHRAVPNRLRGRATALFYLLINVSGYLFGPLAVALLADNVFPEHAGIGPSMAIVTMTAGLLASFLGFASRAPLLRLLRHER